MSRIAIVRKEKCKPDRCGYACMKACPVNMMGSDCIYKDSDNKVGIDEILCSGCRICPKICPFDALSIINLPEIENKPPIHQFGKNGFRIFDLPLVSEGKFTGIVGRNGIGKTSVINVLSGMVKANFGDFDKKEIIDQKYFDFLNERFKGTSLQNYFIKLSKGDIKVSYKPQQIVNIPKIFSGKVRKLLLKVRNDEDEVERIAKRLNVDKILDRDISVLSGGELQRVAICSSLLKEDCNFFVFDEITNYLDIYERLNSSKVIRDVVGDKTSLVVEHDLVVLDYLTDFIHIMYGQPGSFGMMTGIKSSKVGINSYLEGFSREENVRFRDKPISFSKESVMEAKKIEVIAKWDRKKLKAGDFILDVEAGDIKRGEVMGIIGRNALGKSTFISDIAEEGFEMLTISYKRQLIERPADTLVMSELAQFANYEDSFYQVYVLEPLNVKPLLEKNVDELSGGELQRYAIAKCLLQDADIYLFDEPTAFLDIEDRLGVAKILRNFMMLKGRSAFIIDHDLVFMDYLSDRLLVFDGEPSVHGKSLAPLSMREGMNEFLREIGITFRRDEANKRPRVNKEGSVKDSQQKRIGEYYYV